MARNGETGAALETAELVGLCGAFSMVICDVTAEYERADQERGAREDRCPVDAAYVVQLCGEFSRVLYEVSAEHERACAQWEQKYAALERRCQRLEEGLPAARLHRGRLGTACANAVKRGCFAVLRTVFGWGRTLAGRLGIKERLKKSKLFRRLYLRGTIDKLRK